MITAGTRVGRYEILDMIGEGGMGQVYRAQDTDLKRQVAIKVLPELVATDADRLARFQREAEVLAALNHPNIAHIHGLEKSTGMFALVMELVDGPTLADRLAKGALSLNEALSIASQIAEALETAHEQGIVHRDLKPANIKVREDGAVKVLDFGLAKVQDSGVLSSAPGVSMSPTLTSPAFTQLGVIVGTAAYMAPEQAAGKRADRRADIWAFGVVLWEMLTGRRLFEGETVSHTLADVLRAPIDFDALPKDTPASIRALLARCLDRNVATRLRDIGEARVAIQRHLANPSNDRLPPSTGDATTAAWRSGPRIAWAVAGALALVATVLAVIVSRERTTARALALLATVLPPDGADFDFNTSLALPALSPDGSRLVYGAKSKGAAPQLYVRSLDSGTAQPLPGTEGASLPFWSPDSRWIGFAQGTKLKKIAVNGGPAITLADDIAGQFRGGSWNREGVIIFGTNGIPSLMRTSTNGGDPVKFLTPEPLPGGIVPQPVYPWFLPDGRHFLYSTRQEGDIPIRIASLDEPGKPGTTVAQAHSNAQYADGHLLFLRENTLMAQPFDPNRLQPRGDAVSIAEGILTYIAPSRGAAFSVAMSGLLVYQSGVGGVRWRMQWRDRHGASLGTLAEAPREFLDMEFSPDGARVVTTRDNGLYLYDAKQGIPTRFTFSAKDRLGTWSSDGSTIYYVSTQNDRLKLARKASSGMSNEQLLLPGDQPQGAPSASPDGKWLLYVSPPGGSGDIWMLSLATSTPETRVFLSGPGTQARPRFSPDGHWVAYASDESGQFEIYVTAFPGPGGKRQVSSENAREFAWRRDGKELFYATQSGDVKAVAVSVVNGAIELGRTETLFGGTIPSNGSWAPAPDGQKFLVLENAAAAVGRPLTLVQNWTARLPK